MSGNYKVISKFNCCGNVMITVIIDGVAGHVIAEEFSSIKVK